MVWFTLGGSRALCQDGHLHAAAIWGWSLNSTEQFFASPILNSPYTSPGRHWELDDDGQPTQRILERRRPAQYLTPIPQPKKQKTPAAQAKLVFDDGGLSTAEQEYDPTPLINELRRHVDQ